LKHLAGSAEVKFWQGELRDAGASLRQYIEELSNHVTNISQVENSFYVYFHWRDVDEQMFYRLSVALTGLFCYEGPSSGWSPEFSYLVQLLSEEYSKYKFRFIETKFYKFFTVLGSIPYAESYPNGITLIPVQEYLGNIKSSVEKDLKRIYTVRILSPRRLKREAFHRGYDDKGTESSVSDRARRAANIEEFPYLTKDFLEVLRRHQDPLGLLRELGFLLRE